MMIKELGQIVLMIAFMLAAGAVWVWKSHEEWRDGYSQGRYEAQLAKLDAKVSEREAGRSYYEQSVKLFKCGEPDCYCTNDFRFKAHAND